jgi:hypothetical protein
VNGIASPKMYELFFRSLRDDQQALSFPCDGRGHVDMDRLSDHALNDYLFARAFIGKEFSLPTVRPSGNRACVDLAWIRTRLPIVWNRLQRRAQHGSQAERAQRES